jgi:S1-C subfamily serine protease
LTNAHVIVGCTRVLIKLGSAASAVDVQAIDLASDLALLKGPRPSATAVFRRGAAPLGESVTVFGFPLTGTLAATGNLTTGAVSGLAGLSNDPSKYQISAPVQPGNSGGSVLDESGAVIGVVVGRLRQTVTGEFHQNVNFAVKSSVAQNFLEAQGVHYLDRPSGPSRKVREIAEDATKFTALLGCFR